MQILVYHTNIRFAFPNTHCKHKRSGALSPTPHSVVVLSKESKRRKRSERVEEEVFIFFAAVFLRLCPCMTSLHPFSFSFFLQLLSLLQCFVLLFLSRLLSVSSPSFSIPFSLLKMFCSTFHLTCVCMFFFPSHVSVLHSHNNCGSAVTPFRLLADADITRGYVDGDWQVQAPPISSIYLFFTSLTSLPTAHCFRLTSDMNSTNQILKEGNVCVCVCTSGRKQLWQEKSSPLCT